MNTSGIEARVAKLENREGRFDQGFLDTLALDCLSDNELGLVEEFVALSNSGFSQEQIAGMMEPEAFRVAGAAIEKADLERKRLEVC